MADQKTDAHRYEDMLLLPHPVSRTHPPMSLQERAAQFSPFAALTGYDAAVRETARRTSEKIALEEAVKAAIDQKLHILEAHLGEHPVITVTHFVPDERKSGGAYVETTGTVKKLDAYPHVLVLLENRKIPIEDIIGLDGELFNGEEIRWWDHG